MPNFPNQPSVSLKTTEKSIPLASYDSVAELAPIVYVASADED
jgi:hypothetical protein